MDRIHIWSSYCFSRLNLIYVESVLWCCVFLELTCPKSLWGSVMVYQDAWRNVSLIFTVTCTYYNSQQTIVTFCWGIDDLCQIIYLAQRRIVDDMKKFVWVQNYYDYVYQIWKLRISIKIYFWLKTREQPVDIRSLKVLIQDSCLL